MDSGETYHASGASQAGSLWRGGPAPGPHAIMSPHKSQETDGMRNVDQEEVARHGRWLVEILVPAALVMIIVAYVVILIALMMGAGYPPRWTPAHWSAYAEMLTTILTAMTLLGIAYGILYQRQQLADARLAHERELAYRDEQLDPSFIKTTVALAYGWYGVPDGDDRPTSYEFTIRVRNGGGPAHGVMVYLNGAAAHAAAMRALPYERIDNLAARSDAREIRLYRQIADEHRSSVDRNAEFPQVFSGWQCGPLTIEYVNRQNQRRRAEFDFVGLYAGPPQAANYERPVTLVKDEPVTGHMPDFQTLVRGAWERARTDYHEPH